MLAQEPVEVQRAVIGILSIMKSLARESAAKAATERDGSLTTPS
jgi:hypothetical protein